MIDFCISNTYNSGNTNFGGKTMTTVTKKGQITIPKPFRDKLHIKEGDNVIFEIKDDSLVLKRKRKSRF